MSRTPSSHRSRHKSLGTMMVGAKAEPKETDEHYDTPTEGTLAFLYAERRHIQAHGDWVWECACGRGAMARVLGADGFNVHATTLRDRGWGKTGVDFLKTRSLTGLPRTIITNPPFSQTDAFIRHAHILGADYLALLLPSTFFQATARAGRDDLQQLYPPSLHLPLGFRLDFERKGAPVMSCSWFVWDRNRPGNPSFMKTSPALRKPEIGGMK
ncbi:MAG: hypothetical protein RLN89_03435 [Parvibaculum sp.]